MSTYSLTQNTPMASVAPACANDEWIANWYVLQNALAVSGVSGSGGHKFPGTYTSTGGKHLPGISALVAMGSTSELDTLGTIASSAPGSSQYAIGFDLQTRTFKYFNGSAWVATKDFISQDASSNITANISCGGASDLSSAFVDGRDYYHDGKKLDGITRHARSVIISTGTVTHGSNIPWPTDPYTFSASGTEQARNTGFDLALSTWATTDSASGSTTDAQAGNTAMVINASAASGGITQVVKAACAASPASGIFSYYYKSALAGSAQHALWDESNSNWVISYTVVPSAYSYTQKEQVYLEPAKCASMKIYLTDAASTHDSSAACVWYDTVSLKKVINPEIKPSSCEIMTWIAGVNKLRTTTDALSAFYQTTPHYTKWVANLVDDGDGQVRQAYCRVARVTSTGPTSVFHDDINPASHDGVMNYILVAVRNN